MKVLTIEMLRHQCNVDWEDDDEQLTLCGEAAEDAIIGDTHRTFEELLHRGFVETMGREPGEEEEVNVSLFPSRLKMAMLIIANQLYTKREASLPAAQNLVQYSYSFLTKPYRKLV